MRREKCLGGDHQIKGERELNRRSSGSHNFKNCQLDKFCCLFLNIFYTIEVSAWLKY